MARLWRRRGVSSSDIRETSPAVVEAAQRPALFVAPPASAVRRRGYDSDVPRGGTGPKQQSTATTLNRRDLMDQLYGAYLTCPWSSACVDAVARTVTAGGLHIVSDDDTKERTAPADRALPPAAQKLQRLLDFVNPREDIRQVLRGVLVDLQVTGDAFIEVVWLLGLPVALYSLDSATMVPIADEHGDISGYVQEVDADRHADFKPHEVIHISMDSPRGGVYGVGPTQKLMVPITSWLFTAGLVKETMRKGNPPTLHVDWPTEAEYSEMERFDDQYAVRNLGAANIGNPILSRGNAKAQELKAAQIAEYLATLNQRRDEILSGYGVPPSKVGVIESGNLGGGTGTEQDKTYRVNTCGPLGEIVLEKWNFALLDAFGVEGWKLEFGEVDWRDDVVVENIRQMRLKSGVWTWNRYREEIDEPPIEGGDNPIIIERQLIMSVSDVAAFSTATVAATAAAAAGSGTPPTADGDAEDPQAAADGSKATKELPAGQKPPSGAAGQSGGSGKPAAGGKDSASPSAAAAAKKASTSAPAGKSAKESEDIAGWLGEYHQRRREALLELVGEDGAE